MPTMKATNTLKTRHVKKYTFQVLVFHVQVEVIFLVASDRVTGQWIFSYPICLTDSFNASLTLLGTLAYKTGTGPSC